MATHSDFPRMRRIGLALGLALASVTAMAAQDSPPKQEATDAMHGQQGMEGMKAKHANMQGMHTMPATVSAVDTKTGVVDVTAGGMPLKVHFPPASVASLKTGDQITLHLAFSKP
ncbi:hypothetical protein [Dyella sp. EPa41]|uniref:hypothetical protein n=1 Tax=Dyella sp. EPa41 TaxID=1561194 RepID=UPI001915C6FE|nr:hypothetical protein [Dyella sp. EPa41]